MARSSALIDVLVASMKATNAEAEHRKRFLDLTDHDIERLVALHEWLASSGDKATFMDAFYEHLLEFEETRKFLRDEETVARLKGLLAKYFDSLTAGSYGAEYFDNRRRVGAAHWRATLEPQWYLGAYSKYLNLLLPNVRAHVDRDPEKFQEAVAALVKIIFLDLGLAFEVYARCERNAIQEQADRLAALNKIMGTVTTSLDLETVLDQIMCSACDLTRSKASCIAFFDQTANRFTNWVTRGLSAHFVQNLSFRPGGLADEVFTMESTNEALAGVYIASNDLPETQHKLSKLARDEGILGFVCIPLESHDQRLGVIYVYRADRATFERHEIELLQTFALVASQAIRNARLYKQTVDQAIVDPLTKLYNRREFELRLAVEHARAERHSRPYSILFLDIDHFKHINDVHGHAAGDAVLTTLADVLRDQLRTNDVTARYGGEEFVVILPESDAGAAKEIGERVRRAVGVKRFERPDGSAIKVTLSIGIACYPACARSPQEVVDFADQALYAAKRCGRDRVVRYDELGSPGSGGADTRA